MRSAGAIDLLIHEAATAWLPAPVPHKSRTPRRRMHWEGSCDEARAEIARRCGLTLAEFDRRMLGRTLLERMHIQAELGIPMMIPEPNAAPAGGAPRCLPQDGSFSCWPSDADQTGRQFATLNPAGELDSSGTAGTFSGAN